MSKIKWLIVGTLFLGAMFIDINYEKVEPAADTTVSTVPIIKDDEATFNANDVTLESNITEEELKEALSGTKLSELAVAFIQAEKEYKINSIFLSALIAHESGWGESKRSNDGSNNMSGYAVYTSSSKGRKFNSKSESVLETARLLREEYINDNGKFKTGSSVVAINSRYCMNKEGKPDYHWSDSIIEISKDILEGID